MVRVLRVTGGAAELRAKEEGGEVRAVGALMRAETMAEEKGFEGRAWSMPKFSHGLCAKC